MPTPKWIMPWMVCAIAIGLLPAGAAGANGPKIEIEPKCVDFGKQPKGVRLKGTFKLRNIGDQRLVISSVTSSCGCTAARHRRMEIDPGQEQLLEFSVDTSSYIDSTIKLTSNEPGRPRVMLPIRITVLRQVQMNEKSFVFGQVHRGKMQVERIMLWHADPARPVRILSLTSTVASVKLSQRRLVEANREGIEVQATLDSTDVPLGRLGGWVDLRLDLPKEPVIKLEISASIVSGVTVRPNPLSIRVRRSAMRAGYSRPVTLVQRAGHKFRMVRVQSSDPRVLVSVQTRDARDRHELAVRLDPSTPASTGSVRASVLIYTDAKPEPLELRVYYSVRESGRGQRR